MENVAHIDYDALKNDPKMQAESICKFIGIEFEENMLKANFKPNTSFKNYDQRRNVLTKFDKYKIKCFSLIFEFFPVAVFNTLRNIFADKKPRFIPGTFGAIKDSHKMT